ncbi:MAG: metallophosphoesterase family protein [Christensenellaceae bacterium]|jgi:hypothetical protein|nr:metallophosphoesterase family protein [Christensenellaceae bacterium]
MKISRSLLSILIIAALFCFLIASISITKAVADETDVVDEPTPVKLSYASETVIAHVSDLGYYPLSYCYPGDFSGTTYRNEILTGTTIFMESSVIIRSGLAQLAQLSQPPRYLVITGNLTRRGEALGHVEISNYLRLLQNQIRQKSPNFQILVIPGSNDIYNEGASRYDLTGDETPVSSVTRKQFTKLYAGLGYPAITDSEMLSLYNEIDGISIPANAFETDTYAWLTNSGNASTIEFKYQFEANANADDYAFGELSYTVKSNDGMVLFCVDDILEEERGAFSPDSRTLLDNIIDEGISDENIIIGVFHHNVIDHLSPNALSSLITKEPLYNATSTLEYLASNNVRYILSGHAGINDINAVNSFTGNMVIEIITAPLTGYKGGIRYVTIESGLYQSKYAENLFTDIRLVGETDFTELVNGDYISMLDGSEYINVGGIENYITVTSDKDGKLIYKCRDTSEFAATKMFRNMLNSYIYTYVNTEFLSQLYIWVDEIFVEAELIEMSPYVRLFIENILNYLNDVVLEDYGGPDLLLSDVKYIRVITYATELIKNVLDVKPSADSRMTLSTFIMESFLRFMGGLDVKKEVASEDLLATLDKMSSGSIVEKLMQILLYGKYQTSNTGVMRIIDDLMTNPIDAAAGMPETDVEYIEKILGNFTGTTPDMHSIYLDDLAEIVFRILENNVQGIMSFTEQALSETISYALTAYFTSSVYDAVAEIVTDFLEALNFDETKDGGFSEKQLFLIAGEVTFSLEPYVVTPTIENGRLPSMLAITFGTDPATTKNFVWFTNKHIENTDIRYSEGDVFDEETAVKKSGETVVKALTKPSIDFGLAATYTETELARHSISLKGLNPNTTYQYILGDSTRGFEVSGSFTTAPSEDAPFETLIMTDLAGISSGLYSNVATMINNVSSVFDGGYDFIINAGNPTDDGRNITQYEYFLNEMKDIWRNTTIAPVTGFYEQYNYENQKSDISAAWGLSAETDKSPYNIMQLHYNIDLPNSQNPVANDGIYYSFDYGSVHFTMLNTNDMTSRDILSTAQVNWLTKDLSTTTKKYKVVVMNRGVYGQGIHTFESKTVELRRQLSGVFDANGVDIVFQGYDRAYGETYYLDASGDKIDGIGPTDGVHQLGEKKGVLYVSLGTAGSRYGQYSYDPSVPMAYVANGLSNMMWCSTFGRLWSDGENLYYAGYMYNTRTGEAELLRLEIVIDEYSWGVALAIIGGSLALAGVGVGVFFWLINRNKFIKKVPREKKSEAEVEA